MIGSNNPLQQLSNIQFWGSGLTWTADNQPVRQLVVVVLVVVTVANSVAEVVVAVTPPVLIAVVLIVKMYSS